MVFFLETDEEVEESLMCGDCSHEPGFVAGDTCTDLAANLQTQPRTQRDGKNIEEATNACEEEEFAVGMAVANCSDDEDSQLPTWIVCMDHPEEMLKPWVQNPLFFEIVASHCVAVLCGVWGNALVVGVALAERRSSTSLFLASLASADLLLLLVHAPLDLLKYFVVTWDVSGAVCRAAEFAGLLSAVASVLNLAAVTVERFLVIVFPMKSRSYCTMSNCRRAIVAVWIVAPILSAPAILIKGTYSMLYTDSGLTVNVTVHYCDETTEALGFAVYQLVVLFAAPALLMLLCYSSVIYELWKSTRSVQILTNSASMKGSTSRLQKSQFSGNVQRLIKTEDARKTRKQVIKMLISVIVLFLVCWGPRIIMNLVKVVGLNDFSTAIYTLQVVFNILPVVHACMNPIIYSFMSKNFRKALRRQWERLGCKRNLSERGNCGSSAFNRVQHNAKMQHGGLRLRSKPSLSSSTCHTEFTKNSDIDNLAAITDTEV